MSIKILSTTVVYYILKNSKSIGMQVIEMRIFQTSFRNVNKAKFKVKNSIFLYCTIMVS